MRPQVSDQIFALRFLQPGKSPKQTDIPGSKFRETPFLEKQPTLWIKQERLRTPFAALDYVVANVSSAPIHSLKCGHSARICARPIRPAVIGPCSVFL